MKETDLAWAAGFIEGEGSFQIRKWKFKNHIRWDFRIIVVQIDTTPLLDLQQMFGGSIHKDKGRTVSRWETNGKIADTVLRLTAPYYRGKKDQVKLCLEFRNTVRDYSNRKGLKRSLTDSIHQERIILFDKLKEVRRVLHAA